ncbi:4-hydroxy-tetrahydrodipicolinate synthase [Propionispora sp. 2/2-37]|uniref:4-hydroxy-tetrahydrodipicolinate synthase n=1 Tax=Propionispora sp. 2/2-37 TaxID=1677858 RepID=UPI0006BB75BD|nr:4-hydroxy-tetrahydrodipicolinate synthase [Propionispora sp. 2/2-37]CUH96592.1 4-hydroxy-tetrahydrodipicolinate synthase [Propionispora sp. 2/2-37]
MKKTLFTGSAVALVTPFTDNGVNYQELARLIEFQIKEGSDAIVICGTTGEASTMPDEEHIAVIKFAVETVAKRVPVIAGTGSNDTRHAIDLSQAAEAVGADGLLSVTPYYNKTTQKGLYGHFKLIAEHVGIPIILYNVPGRTNLNISPEVIRDLAELDNIVAIKECNLGQVGDVVNLCGEDFAVYSGDDNTILPLLSLGGKGVISTMANIIPQDTHDMVARFFQGDIQGAVKLQLKTLNLIKALFSEVNPIPIKAAVNLLGFKAGQCRMPLTELSDSHLELLRREMKAYGLL